MTDQVSGEGSATSRGASRMSTRLAIALGVLFIAGAAVATFAPASSSAGKCGTWVNPEWTRAKSAHRAAEWDEVSKGFEALNAFDEAASARASSSRVAAAYVLCSEKLDGRRTLALVFVGLGVVLPIAVLFVAGRRTTST